MFVHEGGGREYLGELYESAKSRTCGEQEQFNNGTEKPGVVGFLQ